MDRPLSPETRCKSQCTTAPAGTSGKLRWALPFCAASRPTRPGVAQPVWCRQRKPPRCFRKSILIQPFSTTSKVGGAVEHHGLPREFRCCSGAGPGVALGNPGQGRSCTQAGDGGSPGSRAEGRFPLPAPLPHSLVVAQFETIPHQRRYLRDFSPEEPALRAVEGIRCASAATHGERVYLLPARSFTA